MSLLLLTEAVARAEPTAARLISPVPDSLRAAWAANPTGDARVRVQLRVARAYSGIYEAARAIGHATAALRLARQGSNALLKGEAADLLGHLFQCQQEQGRAAPLLQQARYLLSGAPDTIRASNYLNLGRLYTNLNQKPRARPYYRQAVALFRRGGAKRHEAQALSLYSNNFLLAGQSDSALYCLVEAIRRLRELNMLAEVGVLEASIANVLVRQHKLPEASRYARQALKSTGRQGPEAYQLNAYIVLGHIAREQDSLNRALLYYRRAQAISRRFYQPLAVHYENIAVVMSRQRRPDSAVFYQRQAVRSASQMRQAGQLSGAMARLGRYYLHRQQPDSASYWAHRSQAAQGSTHALDNTLPLRVLQEVALARNDYRQALQLANAIWLKDSTQQARENIRLAEEIRTSYETEQAEQRVKLLEKDQQLYTLRRRQELAFLSGLVVMGGLLGTVFVRRWHQRQRRRERHLRQRLAADLHDDVGSLLTQIALDGALLHAAGPVAGQQQRLGRIVASSQQAVRQLSDVVWSIDTAHGSWTDVLDRMRNYAYEVLGSAGIEIDFVTTPAVTRLPLDLAVCQQLYLVFKEALNNIVKHSEASQVLIRFSCQAGQLILWIQDDGRGGSPTPQAGGRGLKNMQMRAQDLGGTIAYSCQAGPPGFEVELRVPLRR